MVDKQQNEAWKYNQTKNWTKSFSHDIHGLHFGQVDSVLVAGHGDQVASVLTVYRTK